MKSAREAKLRTSWLDPDPEHEEALRLLVTELIHDPAPPSAIVVLPVRDQGLKRSAAAAEDRPKGWRPRA